jgi:hypothetical protein
MFDAASVQRLQRDLTARMDKMKEDLKTRYVEGKSGGGAVSVTANGNQEITAITIQAEAIDPSDPEMLQDLVLAAVNQALDKSRQLNESAVSEITGGLRLPGFF